MSGAEQMAKELAEGLGDSYEIILVAARLNRSLPREEIRPNFLLKRVGLGHHFLDKLLYPILAAWQVKKIKPEIVHGIMESYAGVALIMTKLFYPTAIRLLTLQSGDLDDARKQKTLAVKLFWRRIHLTPDFITAISNFLASRARRLGVSANKIKVIPNGVNLDQIPSRDEIRPGQIICVSRLSWEKGLNFLIEAWPLVLTEFSNAKLLIVGEGPERKGIEEQISLARLSASVVLTGRLPHSEVLKKMTESEIFICPSLAEGLGIVFIEAQACGVPVIGTNVGGIPDVIDHEKTGLLISPGSALAIGNAIIRLLSDPALRLKLSRCAQGVSGRYDWRKIVSEIDCLYRRLYTELNGKSAQ